MSERLRSFSDVPVRARVRAVEAKTALDHLTDVVTPLVVTVAIEDDAVTFTTHAEPEEWWATVVVPTIERWPEYGGAQVAVSRLLLAEAVEVEAQLNPDVDCVVTILEGELMRYGTYALAATTEGASTPRPRLDATNAVGHEITLPVILADGSGVLEVDQLRLLIPAPLHERFGLRSITSVDLYETGGRYVVVGGTGESRRDDRVVVTGFVAPLEA